MSAKQSTVLSYSDYQIDISEINSGISIKIENKLIVRSQKVLILHEQDHSPIYYFPREDVHLALFKKTNKVTYCPYKGEAEHWSLNINGIAIVVAAWSYAQPITQVAAIKNYIAFYPELSQLITIE